MQQYNVGSPFERIAVDIAGPFPVTEDGNKYIMVVSDYFSKWPEAYAIRNQEATTVATTLIDNWGRSELRRGQCYDISPYAAPVRRLCVF